MEKIPSRGEIGQTAMWINTNLMNKPAGKKKKTPNKIWSLTYCKCFDYTDIFV